MSTLEIALANILRDVLVLQDVPDAPHRKFLLGGVSFNNVNLGNKE